MGSIILLALGTSVFPALLACVAIIMSRPNPRRLLLAFYAGGLLTSVITGTLILRVFRDGHEVLGNSSSTPHPTTSIGAGVAALLLAWLIASERGRGLIAGWRTRYSQRHGAPAREKGPSWAERRLDEASARIAFAVGAVINLPSPLYILALGDIATGGYGDLAQLALIALFNAIMFLLLEVPLVGYLVRPEATTQRVATMSGWLNANGLRVMGWVVGAFGVSLVAHGVIGLVG